MFMELVRAIRNARSEYDVEPGRRIAAIIAAGENSAFLEGQRAALEILARVDGGKLHIAAQLTEKPQKALALIVSSLECYLPLADLVDLDKERARLTAEYAQLGQEIARSEKLLANPGFVSKAPAEVVQKERSKVEEYRERQARVKARLDGLS